MITLINLIVDKVKEGLGFDIEKASPSIDSQQKNEVFFVINNSKNKSLGDMCGNCLNESIVMIRCASSKSKGFDEVYEKANQIADFLYGLTKDYGLHEGDIFITSFNPPVVNELGFDAVKTYVIEVEVSVLWQRSTQQ